MFPKSTITHVDIPSGSDIMPEDSASDDIHALLESQFYTMGVEPTWITKALDYLVPRTDGIFIWATVATAAEFLQVNLQERFSMVQLKGDGKSLKACITCTLLSSKHHSDVILKMKRSRRLLLLWMQ